MPTDIKVLSVILGLAMALLWGLQHPAQRALHVEYGNTFSGVLTLSFLTSSFLFVVFAIITPLTCKLEELRQVIQDINILKRLLVAGTCSISGFYLYSMGQNLMNNSVYVAMVLASSPLSAFAFLTIPNTTKWDRSFYRAIIGAIKSRDFALHIAFFGMVLGGIFFLFETETPVFSPLAAVLLLMVPFLFNLNYRILVNAMEWDEVLEKPAYVGIYRASVCISTMLASAIAIFICAVVFAFLHDWPISEILHSQRRELLIFLVWHRFYFCLCASPIFLYLHHRFNDKKKCSSLLSFHTVFFRIYSSVILLYSWHRGKVRMVISDCVLSISRYNDSNFEKYNNYPIGGK
ncbi:MAG: hypothetical protein AAGF33_05390 [Pseudomonadota bacterium]